MPRFVSSFPILASLAVATTACAQPAAPVEAAAETAGTPAARAEATAEIPTAAPSAPEDPWAARAAAVVAQLEAAGADPDAFTVVVEPPFVVVGDEAPERVAARAEGTVRWASERLQAQYFAEHPEPIQVWLFAGEASYVHHADALFGHDPGTPYGYYSPDERALIMNISTGGGTLVHEMVHPFMAANFEACPAWFNEGLASLYEQSGERNGRIVGFTNWRLAGLQEAIEADEVPAFAELLATTEAEFYEVDPGTNYAQARYLLYYLQEHGLLDAYWRHFTANAGTDPSGLSSLQAVLERDDIDAFQTEWEAWVMALSYP